MNFSNQNEITFSVLNQRKILMEQIRQKADEWLNDYYNWSNMPEILISSSDPIAQAAVLLISNVQPPSEIDPVNLQGKETKQSDLSEQKQFQGDSKAEPSNQVFDQKNGESGDQSTNSISSHADGKEMIQPNAFANFDKVLDALLSLTDKYAEAQTVTTMVEDLKLGNFKFKTSHLYETVRSTLRYYHNLFEREGSRWKRKKKVHSADSRGEVKNETEAVTVPAIANKENLAEAIADKNDLTESDVAADKRVVSIFSRLPQDKSNDVEKSETTGKIRTKTYPELCEEILLKSGQSWLHLDQFLVYLEKDHGLKVDKAIVASALRKNAKAGRRFKAYGGNRFGLSNQQNST